MVTRKTRALTLALFSTTVLSTAAWAQPAAPVDATPQTPNTQSPAPGTNARIWAVFLLAVFAVALLVAIANTFR